MPRRKQIGTEGNEEPAAKLARTVFNLPVPEIPKRRGTLLVCGQGDMGQLGLGEDKTECKWLASVPEIGNIVDICAGGMHSLCLTETGDLYSFGCNDEGALGRNTSEEGSEFTPRKVNLDGKCVKMSAGDSHSACLLEDGRVFAWGSFRDSHGSMGLTRNGNERVPMEILPGTKANDISSGADHLVILTCEGHVYTMGCAEQGQLGRVSLREGSGETRRGKNEMLRPGMVQVKFQRRFRAIWTSIYCTFVHDLKSEQIYAFGLNNYSQLGLEKTNLPITVPQKTDFQNILSIAGGQHHTLVLTKDNKCSVIGRKDYGRLGLGEIPDDVTTLTPIKALANYKFVDITCGEAQSFAITTDRTVYAWGMGSNLSLGTGKEDDEMLPVLITSKQARDKRILKVASGGQHTLFLVENEENSIKVNGDKNQLEDHILPETVAEKTNGDIATVVTTKEKGRKRKN